MFICVTYTPGGYAGVGISVGASVAVGKGVRVGGRRVFVAATVGGGVSDGASVGSGEVAVAGSMTTTTVEPGKVMSGRTVSCGVVGSTVGGGAVSCGTVGRALVGSTVSCGTVGRPLVAMTSEARVAVGITGSAVGVTTGASVGSGAPVLERARPETGVSVAIALFGLLAYKPDLKNQYPPTASSAIKKSASTARITNVVEEARAVLVGVPAGAPTGAAGVARTHC